MKLFTKFNRINLAAMILVFLFSGVMYYLLLSRMLIHELDEALGEYRSRLDRYLTEQHKLPELNTFDEVAVAFRLTNKTQPGQWTSVSRYNAEEDQYSAYRQLIFTRKVDGQLYEINIAKPVEGVRLVTRTVATMTLTLLLIIIVISILLNRVILKRLWQPFYDTIHALKKYRLGGNEVPRLPASDIEEFAFMNQSLSGVIQSAHDDYLALKEFTENASHELQTPLAIIRSKLDLVIQEEGLSEKQSVALKSAYAGIHRLTKLNQSLLLLAKIENQQFNTTDQVDVKDKIEAKLNQFSEFWSAKNITVSATVHPAVIQANRELMEILLNNLLSNAGRHNYDGGEIRILLDTGTLSVCNTATEQALDKSKLFTRFYKETISSSSNGLGLSIVKQICERSGITIQYSYDGHFHRFDLAW